MKIRPVCSARFALRRAMGQRIFNFAKLFLQPKGGE